MKIKRYTVSFDATGRYYLALQVEVSDIKPWPKMGKQVGVDLGTSDYNLVYRLARAFSFAIRLL